MEHLVIIGARGWGREVLDIVKILPDYVNGKLKVKGFLDDKQDALEGLRGDYPPIISSVEDYKPQSNDVFVCALGDCNYRKKYADIILNKGGRFISVVHPLARLSSSAQIEQGGVIGAFSIISNNVTIGDFTMVHGFTTLGHDVTIGKYNSIESYCFFGG